MNDLGLVITKACGCKQRGKRTVQCSYHKGFDAGVESVTPSNWRAIVKDNTMLAYAVRYCMTRDSYALIDGLELANDNWAVLDEATRRDVLRALKSAKTLQPMLYMSYPNIKDSL